MFERNLSFAKNVVSDVPYTTVHVGICEKTEFESDANIGHYKLRTTEFPFLFLPTI